MRYDDINILPRNKNTREDLFQQRLKMSMEKAQLNQLELAKRVGLSQTAINKYLSGKSIPRKKQLEKLAKVLKVNELWLQGYNSREEKPKSKLQIGASDILKTAEDRKVTLESEDDIYKREQDLEYLELYIEKSKLFEKIEKLTAEELFIMNLRFDELNSIDDDDWEILIQFNKLKADGKNKVLEYAKDLNQIKRYCEIFDIEEGES